jgi:hypothetical protein
MPSISHEGPLDLVRQHPEITVDLIAGTPGIHLPRLASPEISDADRFRMMTIILRLASDAARHLLEAMMTTSEYEKTFVERIHDQGIAEGEAKGEVKGKAEAVLKLLDARHLVPSGEQRQWVTSCTDALQLDRWFDRAITAGTAAEVFAD